LRKDYVGLQVDQLFGEDACTVNVAASSPTNFHPQILAIRPTQLSKCLRKSGKLGLSFRIAFFDAHQHADAAHTLALLRACR